MSKLKISDVFYSLQGEGAKFGTPSIFVRLFGCNLECPFCDTKINDYVELSLDELIERVKLFHCKKIIWTGGEPTLQLTDSIVAKFKELGYEQSIETNGLLPIPKGLDYITISPKSNYIHHSITKANELRFIINNIGDEPPIHDFIHLRFNDLFISPAFKNENLNFPLLKYCEELCKKKPMLRLSVQMHKMLRMP